MSIPFFFFLCLLFGLSYAGIDHNDNHNGHKDPDWTKMCREGKKQSPINITTSEAVCHNTISPLLFENFEQNGTVNVWNIGETGVVDGFETWENRPIFVRKEYRLRYYLKQIHFHWDMGHNGSEHSIDAKQSTAEMHLVFTLGGLSVNDSKCLPYGLVVVGVLLDVIPGSKLGIYEDVILIHDYEKEKKFIDHNFDLSTKIPKNAEYFRYNGSLTTPDCEENVHWIVFKNPMGMAQDELDSLRKLHDPEHFAIDHNHRIPKEINGRKVDLYSNSCS